MMTRMAGLARIASFAVAACAAFAGPARAQHPAEPAWSASDTSSAKFARLARAGTARYRNQRAAIDDGFVRLGMDFPSMGQHWVNPEFVMIGVLDPARPAILSYTDVNGSPELVGLVYAIPLAPQQSAPDFPTRAAWHIHAGSVSDESLLLDHDIPGSSHATMNSTRNPDVSGHRLAVLHAWAWTENPDGLFVTDNWTLPFRRVGFTAPAKRTAEVGDASRSLSLVAGDGEEYFRRLLTAIAHPDDPSPDSSIANAVAAGRRAADAWLNGHRAANRPAMLASEELHALAAIWRDLWANALKGLAPDARHRLEGLAATWRCSASHC